MISLMRMTIRSSMRSPVQNVGSTGRGGGVSSCRSRLGPFGGFGDRLAHAGVGLHVLKLVIVHHAEVSAAQRLGNRAGDFRLGEHHGGAVGGDVSDVFLLLRDGHRAALLGLGLEAALVGFGAIRGELCAEVLADVDVGDVNGENLESRVRIESLAQDGFGDRVGVFQDVFVIDCRADRVDDSFADAGDDGFLGGSADEALDVGSHGDAGRTLS